MRDGWILSNRPWFVRLAGRGDTQARVSHWTTGRFLGLLMLVVVALYSEVLSGERTFFFRDFGFFGYPLASHWRSSVLAGEWPLWNPLNNCGLPFLAQWNTMVLYPPMILCLVFPLAWALPVLNLAHLVWGGLGMRRLTAARAGGDWGPVVAGLAFAFGGMMLNCLTWPNNIAALAWMPWVVHAVERACREGGQHLWKGALCGGIQMLAGGVEIILLTWVVVGALWLHALVRGGSPRRDIACRFALILFAVACLAAVQLAPFLQFLVQSHRSTGFGDGSWSMPLSGWANLLVPLFRSTPLYQGVYFLPGQAWTTSYYVGLGTLWLGLLGLLRSRCRGIWWWGAVGLAALVLAWGDAGGVYAWLRSVVPVMSFMRFPIKFVVLLAFALPLLAGCSLSWFESLEEESRRREARVLLGIAAALALGVVGVVMWGSAADNFSTPLLSNAFWRVVLLGAMAAGLWGGWVVRPTRWRTLSRLALVLFMGLDLATHSSRQIPTVEPWVYRAGAVADFLPANPRPVNGVSRAMISADAKQTLRFSWLDNPEDQYVSRRAALLNNCNLLDGVAKVDGFFSLYPAAHVDLLERLYAAELEQPKGLVDFIGVSHVTREGSLFDWEMRSDFRPLIAGGQAPVFAEPTEALQGLSDPNFDPLRTVYLPVEATGVAGAAARVEVNLLEFSTQRVAINVSADGPCWVTIAQNWYPCWKARVDGERVRLWRANHAFQAVAVPAGEHRVELVYEDRAFAWGGVVSAASLLGCGIGWGVGSRRERKI